MSTAIFGVSKAGAGAVYVSGDVVEEVLRSRIGWIYFLDV